MPVTQLESSTEFPCPSEWMLYLTRNTSTVLARIRSQAQFSSLPNPCPQFCEMFVPAFHLSAVPSFSGEGKSPKWMKGNQGARDPEKISLEIFKVRLQNALGNLI